MKRIDYWLLIGLFLLAGFLTHLYIQLDLQEVRIEIQELRDELQVRGELIARLQEQIEYTNAKATWLLRKIDKRRILIPVLNGDVYKIVEIEADFKSKEVPD